MKKTEHTPSVRNFLWTMIEDAGIGIWLDPVTPDTSAKPYASYVTDFSEFCTIEDTFAALKLRDLLHQSDATENTFREIFKHHPNFESSPVRCKLHKSTEGYDPYTALVFLFNSKQIVILVPWHGDTDPLLLRSSQALEEAEFGTFIGKTFRFLKAFPLPSAHLPNPFIRFLKRRIKPYTELLRSFSRAPGAR